MKSRRENSEKCHPACLSSNATTERSDMHLKATNNMGNLRAFRFTNYLDSCSIFLQVLVSLRLKLDFNGFLKRKETIYIYYRKCLLGN